MKWHPVAPPFIRFNSFICWSCARRRAAHPDADPNKTQGASGRGSEQRQPPFSLKRWNAAGNAFSRLFAESFAVISAAAKSAWLPPQHCVSPLQSLSRESADYPFGCLVQVISGEEEARLIRGFILPAAAQISDWWWIMAAPALNWLAAGTGAKPRRCLACRWAA